MIAFTYFITTIVIFYVILLRGLPRLLSWIASKILKCELKIGHVGLFPPSLKNLQIRRDEATVIIDSLGISSSLVNSNYGKLIAVYVSDVRVQRDPKKQNAERSRRECRGRKSSVPIHVPPHLLTVLQIASVHVYNINVIVYKTFENCLAHASATEIKVEGATHHPHLQVIFGIENFTGRALRHIEETNNTSQPCLAEVSFSSEISVSLDPRENWRIKGVNFSVQPVLDIRFSEGILGLFSKSTEYQTSQPGLSVSRTNDEDDGQRTLKPVTFLPEDLQISLGNSCVKFTSEGPTPRTSLNLAVTKASLEINALQETWESFTRSGPNELLALPGHMSTTFVLDQLTLSCEQQSQLLCVQKCTLSVLSDGKTADINLDLLTFSAFYHHDKFWPWLAKMAKRRRSIAASVHRGPPKRANPLPAAKVTVEVRNACCWFQMGPAPRFGAGIRRAKLQGHVCPETRTVDMVVESLWCRLGEVPYPDNPIKKQHYWNTPLFVSVLLVKARDEPDVSYSKLEAMVDGVQAEWCPKLRDFLNESRSCVEDWKVILPRSGSGKPQGGGRESPPVRSVTVTVTGTNVFATGKRNVGMMLRVDSGSAESDGHKISVSLEGIKLAPLIPTAQHTMCSKSCEMTECMAWIGRSNVRFDVRSRSLRLLLSEEVGVNWAPTDHMMACEVLDDVKQVQSKEPRQQQQQERRDPFVSSFECNVNGTARLAAKVSQSRRLEVAVKNLRGSWRSSAASCANCDEICVYCDGHNIATFHKIAVDVLEDGGPALRADRENFEELTVKCNRAWIVSIDMVHVSFPDRYSFAEAFTEQTLGVLKWLRTVHRVSGKKPDNESLPADSLVKIKEFVVVLEDDAFEAKLRDNYVLLEDEYNESLKRWKMLNVKLDELRKTHLLLPAGKVEELFSSLLKKNADIYVRRWRQMYAGKSPKTRLFTARAEGLEILAMADPDFHGKERVVHHMRTIDPQSPYPEEGLRFSTLWCRMVRVTASVLNCHLRDYPAPCLNAHNLLCWGRLVGAEQEANHRGKRTTVIELNHPWPHATVERNMSPLKFFHDFSCDMERLTMGYGPCWEPAMAQYGLASDLVSRPSVDPSLPLPFWDKMRLIFHGRLTLMVQQMTMVMHASHDPYNTTEQMDFSWSDLIMDWTNTKFVLKGNLDVYVRTASKYDDCRLLRFPNLKLSVKLDWQCLGDPNDHHAVRPCAPDKLPEYSSNQEHDSYRAFRSLNLNLAVSMETKSCNATDQENIPSMLFYNSTLRWLDNLQSIVKNVTRPIRRGPIFRNLKPKKPSLSRHYKFLRFSIALHRLKLCYWSSFAKQRGFQIEAGKLTMSSEHNLSLMPVDDGLKHRPFAEWTTAYMNCELNDGDMWLQIIGLSTDDSNTELNVYYNAPVEKSFFLSLTRLSYGREAPGSQDTPTHRLVIHDLQGAWTKNNRAIAFGLFDSFMKNKLTRHNLSTEALKGFRVDSSSSPMKSSKASKLAPSSSSSPSTASGASPMTRIQSGQAMQMLQKLISEADSNAVVFSEDLPGSAREQLLHGVAACQAEDVLQQNWLVELINSQVLLKGCETAGYVIMSAARARILQRLHRPVWKECTIVSKTTWVGSLECMQYYATVDPGDANPSAADNIQWLTVDNIEEKESLVIADPPDLVGSGQGVGGVVSNTVGGGSLAVDGVQGVQLQRIVSRCGCQFFYASYGDSVDPGCLEQAPPLPPEDSDLWKKDVAVDSFTLTHHDLNCCTNSLQYAMILDIVNNLLLYVEPRKKEAIERLQRMRFQLQLSSVEDQRRPIQQLQNNLRTLVSNLRQLERETYILDKAQDGNDNITQQIKILEQQMYETKVQINAQSEELAMMISCFKETQLSARQKMKMSQNHQVLLRRRNEVSFKHAQWRLTEADGQLGIADILLANFLYSKITKDDDAAQHLLELGYVKVINLLPNQVYKDVLQPTGIKGSVPMDRQCALRVFCREKAPVGGISIKEHFEINVVPLTLRLTSHFFKTMMKFSFPERDTEKAESEREDSESDGASLSNAANRGSRRRALQPRRAGGGSEDRDDIDKMKERAENNKMFLYIKIPEVPVQVSYKGEKEKNIRDVHNFHLVLPTLEYHNVTWTWLDVLLAMKNDSKKALLSQAIKQKLQIKSTKIAGSDGQDGGSGHVAQYEDKARLLLGSVLTGGKEKGSKSSFGKSGK